jgi:hypothetical protein
MERFAQGAFHVAYEQRFDLDALRSKRAALADEQRRKAGLDALLVWKDENCRYLTDLRPQLIAGKTTALNGALLVEGECPDTILFRWRTRSCRSNNAVDKGGSHHSYRRREGAHRRNG